MSRICPVYVLSCICFVLSRNCLSRNGPVKDLSCLGLVCLGLVCLGFVRLGFVRLGFVLVLINNIVGCLPGAHYLVASGTPTLSKLVHLILSKKSPSHLFLIAFSSSSFPATILYTAFASIFSALPLSIRRFLSK